MNRSRRERLERLFVVARELDPAARDEVLARECRDDAALREEIEALIASASKSEDYFDELSRRIGVAALFEDTPLGDLLSRAGAMETADIPVKSPRPDASGDPPFAGTERDLFAGAYRLVRELGSGGMASVWLAYRSDGLIQRPVALKLAHGAWRRAGLVERMAREREILAALTHPNIARLYDAGLTEDGQPYLALEYVEGMPIDRYCLTSDLTVRDRLRLFIQVAAAVAYAHAQLVVHRDIKPSNVLVTRDGDVKLLDFGIAKLLAGGEVKETKLTQAAGRALTPDYASPEQICGEPLTVASDIYSLGVLLYELLAGTRPYKLKRDSRGALEEAIVHADPQRPSDAVDGASRKALRGDLDTIVLKALKKQPAERYATVHALIDDLQRHLDRRPVLARPDRRWYRVSRFTARHKFGVAAAATALSAMVIGSGVAMWQSHEALQQQRRAEAVKDFMVSIFREADPYASAGKPPSVADLLRNARQRIDAAFLDQPPLRVELLSIVGSSANAIQDFDTAQAVLDGAMKEASAAFGPEDPRTLHARVLRLSVLRYRGQTDAMRAELEDLLPMLRRHPAGEDLILAIENHAHLAIDEGRYVDAESYAQEAVELATQELGERAAYTTALSSLLVATYRYNKKYDLAYPMARRTFERTLELVQNDSLHPSLIDARVAYGRALADVGQLAAGIEQLERATGDARTLLGPSSAMVGFFSGQLAWLLVDDGNLRDAVSYADEHLSVLTKIAAPGSFTYASTLFNHGAIVLAARQTQRAVEELQQAQQMLAGTLGPTHDLSRRAQVEYALALAHAGRFAEARRQLDERLAPDPSGSAGMDRALYVSGVLDRLEENHDAADAALQAALGAIQPGAKASLMRMRILVEIGLNCLEQGADRAALDALQEAIALSDQLERQVSPTRADAMVAVGRIRLQQSDRDEAIAILRAAHEFWGGFDPENRWAGVAALWLGTAYREAGMSSEAGAALARARRVLARSPLPADAEMLAHNGKFIQ